MKYFMIKYQRRNGSESEWHRSIAQFIAALDSDADLKSKISYRCMKRRGSTDYFHLAAAADDEAVKACRAATSSPATPSRPSLPEAGTSKSFRSKSSPKPDSGRDWRFRHQASVG